MNPAITISLLSAILNICLGFYILIINPRKNVNRIFFIFTLSVITYNIGEFFVRTAASPETALIPGVIAYSVLWISPGTGLHWSYIFPRITTLKKYESIFKYLIIFVYIFGFFLYLFFINTVSIGDVKLTEFGYRLVASKSTSFFIEWYILICGSIITVLAYKYFRGKLYSYEKNQLRIIWFGLVLVILIAVFTNLLPPMFNVEIFPMSSFFTFIFVLFTTYAIVKYRFLSPIPEIIADKILETINDIVIVLDKNKKIISVNKAATNLLGYDLKELKDSSIDRFVHSSEIDKIINGKLSHDLSLDTTIEKNGTEEFEAVFKNKDGKLIPMGVSASVVRETDKNINGLILVARDLTKIKKSLKEKEILLKEIHHRVKNNLQLIISLLEFQSDQIKDKKVLNIFQESQNRIRLMSSFYEQLYQSKDIGEINFKEYINSILAKLFHSFKKTSNNIRTQQIIDDISLDLNYILLSSFIISELVTNSLKHAFPNNQNGIIKIDFHLQNNKYLMTVSDNGIGLPNDIDIHQTKTLGLQLVLMFVQQLKGNIKLDRKNGTKFTITFPLKQHLDGG